MFENLDIKDIILGILVILVIYLIYKTRNLSEKFDSTTTTPVPTVSPIIKQAIADTYKVDFDAMRNLGQLADTILNGDSNNPDAPFDTLTLPATNTKIVNLEVSGNVTFTNKDTAALEIFPKFMVIAWAYPDVPILWAPCDGYYYILNSNNYAERVPPTTTGSVQTPDLRGRFILGSGVGGYDMNNNALSNRNLRDFGGEENHTLTINEMPSHNHFLGGVIKLCGSCADNDSNNLNLTRSGSNSGDTGGNQKHNNMPPFYVLTYIMKL